jgi:UDP-GlcNAc:undecaprenyl-phosphate GlcNAc-1-phosphate transferase
MATLIFLFVSSFSLCLVLTPLARLLATRYGLVDRPDGGRKRHGQAIPVAGGLAILVSGAIAVGCAVVVPNPWNAEISAHGGELAALLLASVVICGVGVLDDYGYLRGRHKLVGQLTAAGILIASGLVIRNVRLFQIDIELGVLAVPFTAFFLLGAINALNMLDGMDGLLTALGLVLSLAMAALVLIGQRWYAAPVAVALAGALLGFLRYNFPPARIFLGDAGSMLIGLVIGMLAIQTSLKEPATIMLATPLALLAVPILDITAAIVRRKLTGRSLYATDRCHLHHCLLNRGLSDRRALLWITALCLLSVGGAIAGHVLNNDVFALVAVVVVTGTLLGTRLFGYAEFTLVKQRFLSYLASFGQGPGGKPREVEVRLQGSADWKELWAPFVECARDLDLRRIHLHVNAPALNEGYDFRWDDPHDTGDEGQPRRWVAELSLMVHNQSVGRLDVVGCRDGRSIADKIATLMKLVENLEVFIGDMEQYLETRRDPAHGHGVAEHSRNGKVMAANDAARPHRGGAANPAAQSVQPGGC